MKKLLTIIILFLFTGMEIMSQNTIIDSNTTITVCFSANHTYVSDLGFYLKAPGYQFAEPGDPGCIELLPPVSNWSAGFNGGVTNLPESSIGCSDPGQINTNCNSGDDIFDFCFTTTLPAGDPNYTACVCDLPVPLTGNYASAGPWDAIYGQDITNSGWTVQIYDCEPIDVGYLTHVSLTFVIDNILYMYDSGPIVSVIEDMSCDAATASLYACDVYMLVCYISGKVFNDLNADCIQDINEDGLQNRMITAVPGPYYGITNQLGFYSILVDTGSYAVSLMPFNPLWQQNCPVSPDYYEVNFASPVNDTVSNINFGVEVDVYCPVLNVDIATWSVRPCFQSTYSVSYCNNGTIDATNTTIEVELDDNMTYAGGGNLISQTGNVLTFDVGTVNFGQCGSFSFQADVDCDSSLIGQTMCVEAHIYPDTSCFPADPAWDHSSVAVEGSCADDSLACFTIYNTGGAGTGDMAGTSEYRIYENNILVYTGTFQINGGDSLVICWAANGNTIRLEADQHPGHPGNSHPQDNIEMCGDSTDTFVTGQITVIPEDDDDIFIEIDCHIATAAIDPNEKQVKPEGLSEKYNFINSTDILEYLIHFQNTGTDTAINIVIYDVLSPYLDVTTIEPVASSHQYTLNIIGSKTLQWKFDSIMLPDSIVDEPASNGFVKFKIHQMPGNATGTIIENNASIIFDFWQPIITNTVFNTVVNTDSIITSMPIVYDEEISVKVYPNPFNSTTTFEIQGMNQPVTFELYNIIGEQVKSISDITGKKFIISRENLSNGIYIYKISSKDKLICAGKLIVN